MICWDHSCVSTTSTTAELLKSLACELSMSTNKVRIPGLRGVKQNLAVCDRRLLRLPLKIKIGKFILFWRRKRLNVRSIRLLLKAS